MWQVGKEAIINGKDKEILSEKLVRIFVSGFGI